MRSAPPRQRSRSARRWAHGYRSPVSRPTCWNATGRETGPRAPYVVSITDRAKRVREHVHAAVENGADGVLVAALATGLDTLQEVAEMLDGRLAVTAPNARLDRL